jgi:CheY-like chemotaxis protein
VPKILIVEDSPDSMRLFRTLLTMKGHEVVGLAAATGCSRPWSATVPSWS